MFSAHAQPAQNPTACLCYVDLYKEARDRSAGELRDGTQEDATLCT